MATEKLLDVMIGTAAIGAIDTVDKIPVQGDYMDIGKLILQIIIAIGSLVTIIRKKNTPTSNP